VLTRIEIRTEDELQREEEARARRLMQALQAQHAEAQSLIGAAGVAAGADGSPVLTGETAPSGAPRSVPAAARGGGDALPGLRGIGAAPAPGATPGGAPFVRDVPKVGRNEPCPCGSGRKYKHCHGALAGASG
jgi:preprotein translocase subunit SecA